MSATQSLSGPSEAKFLSTRSGAASFRARRRWVVFILRPRRENPLASPCASDGLPAFSRNGYRSLGARRVSVGLRRSPGCCDGWSRSSPRGRRRSAHAPKAGASSKRSNRSERLRKKLAQHRDRVSSLLRLDEPVRAHRIPSSFAKKALRLFSESPSLGGGSCSLF